LFDVATEPIDGRCAIVYVNDGFSIADCQREAELNTSNEYVRKVEKQWYLVFY
jgi:hypothetical protein